MGMIPHPLLFMHLTPVQICPYSDSHQYYHRLGIDTFESYQGYLLFFAFQVLRVSGFYCDYTAMFTFISLVTNRQVSEELLVLSIIG